MEVRTYYRHRIREARARTAVLHVYVERIELFADGLFVGEVRYIPDDLARVQAAVDRAGGVRLDRELFIVGDPYAGFELISTRHYGGFVLDRFDRRDGYRAGRLDFRRKRVTPVRRSRFFDPYHFTGFVPIALLPDDDVWLTDYGYRAPSRYWFGAEDGYYYGRASSLDDYVLFDGDRTQYAQTKPRGPTSGRSEEVRLHLDPVSDRRDERYETRHGVDVHIRRQSTLERIE